MMLRSLNRKTRALALVAASAGIAMFSPGDSAFGTTYTFTTGFGDWNDSANWTPTGVPGSGDLAQIRTITPATNVDMTLNAANMTMGGILYDTSTQRKLFNATSDATNSVLTLNGAPGVTQLINLNRTDSSLFTTFTIQAANGGTGTGTLGLVLAADGDIRAATGGTLAISADISQSGGVRSFTKTGGGTLILSGNNSVTGSFLNTAGTIIISGNSNFASATLNAGVLVLSGSNAFTSGLFVNDGTVRLDFSGSAGQKAPITTALSLNGGTINQNGNTSAAVSQSFAGATLAGGQSHAIVDTTAIGVQGSTLDLGAITRTTGTGLNVTTTVGGPSAVVRTANGNDSGIGFLGGWATVAGNDWAMSDIAVPGNIVAYSGYATRDDVSTWQINENITDSAGFSNSLPLSLTIASLRFNTNNTAAVNIASGQTLAIRSGGIMITSGSGASHTIAGGSITSLNGQDLIVFMNGTLAQKSLTISSVISDLGVSTVGVTKNGLSGGTLVLSGANTFTGPITVNVGTLDVNSISDMGSPGFLGVGGANGTLTLQNGANLVVSGTANGQTDRPIVLGPGGATLRLPTGPLARTNTLTGPISGPGFLVKAGVGNTLIIQGAKTFAGTFSVNIGSLIVDSLAPIGSPSGIGTGLNGSTLTLGSGNAGTLTYTGPTATTDHIIQLGNGQDGGSINIIVTQPGTTATFNGNLFFNSGQPSSQNANGTSITFATGAANVRPFVLDTPGTIIFNGSIGSGAGVYGQLRKNGTGTVILGGNNSYRIGTTVNNGTLITTTNFSNGTVTTVTQTSITGLNIVGGMARVAQKAANNDPAGVTAIPSLAVGGSSQLDLTNNALLVYNASSPVSQIRTLLTNGYAGGNWTGTNAIVSTTAGASPMAHKTALGYAQASDLFTSFPATFAGKTIPEGTDVIVAYVLSGDANLDGVVNGLDFNALASNFGSGQSWITADFNYDNTVNSGDFNAIASNFGLSTPAPAAALSMAALVPEPGSAVMLALLAGVRRKRHATVPTV